MMKCLYKISFSLLIFIFIAFFLGKDVVNYPGYDKAKIENTANFTGSLIGGIQESSNEEDVTFFLHAFSDQILACECQNLTLPAFGLLPDISYPVWLPPDIS